MYKDYKSINGETLVSDEKGMHKKETHNSIGVELELENEIEILEYQISSLIKEKEKCGTIKSNKKLIKKCYKFTIGIILLVIGLVKILFPMIANDMIFEKPILNFIHKDSDLQLILLLPVSLVMISPLYYIYPKEIRDNIMRIQTIEEQLEYLNNELTKKIEELETLRKQSKKQNVNDTTIHTIDNSKYQAELKERLNLLSYIRQYKDILRKYLEKGTLIEEFRNLDIKAENISFAETALKRVLEKSYSEE